MTHQPKSPENKQSSPLLRLAQILSALFSIIAGILQYTKTKDLVPLFLFIVFALVIIFLLEYFVKHQENTVFQFLAFIVPITVLAVFLVSIISVLSSGRFLCGYYNNILTKVLGIDPIDCDDEEKDIVLINGKWWTTNNLATGENSEYISSTRGSLYSWEEAKACCQSVLGAEWELPTGRDFEYLMSNPDEIKKLKLIRAGYYHHAKNKHISNEVGYYWTSKENKYPFYAVWTSVNGRDTLHLNDGGGAYGYSVRCVKNK